ncbi:MAG: ATP-dependent DNA helicase UvrD2 [Micrococcales bacterium]|nr:ATP-dependent DNA helicase UvrD2 [Micrococcales bacterium]
MSSDDAPPASAEAILDALDPEQRQVASALLGPVCVLAGAGTGKTRAITHRIAYGVRTNTYDPSSVLAITFTTRAAGEMRSRLRTLGAHGVQARTFHSAALRQLTHFLPKLAGTAVPRLIEHKAPAIAQAAKRVGLEVDRAAVRDYAAEIEWAKVQMWTPEDYQAQATSAGRGEVCGSDPTAIARLMRAYELVLSESQSMDFEDVLLAACGLLGEYPQAAEEVRRRYRFFTVDEYQDVSPVQQHLLDLWLGEREELCVVGDPSQTIYSFTGATSRHLLEFATAHPTAPVIRLVRDYRSTPQVVGLANAVLRARPTRGEEPPAPALDLVAQRHPGPEVTYQTHADDGAEAAGIARLASALVASGVDPSGIAVLYRTNSQSEPFEYALAEAGLPYQVRGGARFFSRPEVRQVIALLKTEARTVGDSDMLDRAHSVLEVAGWSTVPPAGRGAVREKWESLDALERLIRGAISQGAESLAQIVAVISDRQAHEHAPEGAGITLASLHAAKGLEWDAVFLAGLADGLLPISLAVTPMEIAEERRLLYVGITRAREHLNLSFAAARTAGGSAGRKPSRFLAPFWGAATGAGGRAPVAAVPKAEELSTEQTQLVEALRAWRKEEASRLGRPAFTIVTDVTLRAIASRRPTTLRELAAIPGIGPVKMNRYGPALLMEVAQHAKRPGHHEGPKSAD